MKPELKAMKEKDWYEMTEEIFDRVFKNTPVKRTGYNGLKRNLKFIRRKTS
jgi:epoxyqueuosine reductase